MYDDLPTPAYVISEAALRRNLAILDRVQQAADCRILLALKAFAMTRAFPLLREVLAGTAASSLHEARLAFEHFGDSVHLCAPVYRDAEIERLAGLCGHIVFNSFSQQRRLRQRVTRARASVSCAIRVNPEHSEVETGIYDPCAPGSRLGVTREHFEFDALDGIDGLHFHTLCGVNADALRRTLDVVEDKFSSALAHVKWVNFGGGHHITREDYAVDELIGIVRSFRSRHDVEVYLEPGEAVVLNAGVLVGQVLDVLPNGTAVLDVSATCHMPDVLEMPYRPDIADAGLPGERACTSYLGGPTCLAGDMFGQYSFDQPVRVGQRIVFEDMACYTMVKNTMFNGVNLPAIYWQTQTGELQLVRSFEYADYVSRLG